MLIVLIRHGHKSHQAIEDPSLTEKGFEQSIVLNEKLKSKTLPWPTKCYYSDKIRTFQTLQKVIEHSGCKHEKKPELSVRNNRESSAEFRKRIQDFINGLNSKAAQPENRNHVIYLCTHYDWIEEAMTLIPCAQNLNSFEYASWSPAQYIEFFIDESSLWSVKSKGECRV